MRKRLIRLLVILLLTIPLCYLAIQMFPLLYPSYEYQTAITYTLSDGFAVSGVAVRTETPLATSDSALLDYLVSNGSRVSAGTVVAETFASQQQSEQRAAEKRLTAQIDVLGRSQDPAQTTEGDMDILLKQKQQDLYALLKLTDTGDYSTLAAAKSALTCSANRLQIATGRETDYNALVAQLTAERDATAASVGQVGYLTVDSAGYFSSKTDGLEQTLTPQALDAMTPAEAAALIEAKQLPGSSAAGKVIHDYQWYYYCVVTDAQAKRFEEDSDQKVTIDFHYTGVRDVPAQILSIQKDASTGQTLVKLACTYVNADTVNLRFENASVNFKSYTGLRVDAAAKHIVDGQVGVYVKFGDLVQFKKISPLYENAEYLLLPTQSAVSDASNQVVLYDEIIVSGKNLYDGKLL